MANDLTLDDLKMFRLLAEPSKIRMSALLLRTGPLTVGDVQKIIGNPQTSISRQLGKLLRVGVMQKSRHQQWFFYSVNPERKRAVKTFVDLFSDSVFSKDLQLYRDFRASGELIERDSDWHTYT